jgi:hypothetical protein
MNNNKYMHSHTDVIIITFKYTSLQIITHVNLVLYASSSSQPIGNILNSIHNQPVVKGHYARRSDRAILTMVLVLSPDRSVAVAAY